MPETTKRKINTETAHAIALENRRLFCRKLASGKSKRANKKANNNGDKTFFPKIAR
jgi:hypothetical protein